MQIRAHHWLVAFTLASALHAGVLLAVDLGGDGPTVVGVGGGVRISLGDGTGTLGGGVPGAGALSAADAGVNSGRPSPPSLPSAPAVLASPPEAPRPVERVASAMPVVPRVSSARDAAIADESSAVPIPLESTPTPTPTPEPVQVAAATGLAPVSAADPIRAAAPADGASPSAGGGGGSGGEGSESSGRGGAVGDGGPLSDGSGQGGGEAGLAGLDPAYVRRFMASIEREKRYPRAARNQRLEGTALLWIRLDRSGRVLAYDVEESSGHVLLDRAVVRTIERADPLPPLPASYPKAEVEMLIPIAFQLR